MTASGTAANRDRGTDVEDIVCERWPCDLTDPDGRLDWYDFEFVQDLNIDRNDRPVVPAGTKGDAKSCYVTYEDGDRAGRWWIDRENHEALVDADGEYALAVIDGATGDVERLALVPARSVDALIDGDWWDCGDGGRTAEEFRQLPWTAVFDSLDAEGGDGA